MIFLGVSVYQNMRKYKKKLILEQESSISQNTRNFFSGGFFKFFFSSLCLKLFQIAAYYTTQSYFQKHSKNVKKNLGGHQINCNIEIQKQNSSEFVNCK